MKGNNDRDNRGRFAKGNRGGPSRPSRAVEIARELQYLGIVLEEVTPQVWRDVVRRAIEDTKGGDASARLAVATSCCYKPEGNPGVAQGLGDVGCHRSCHTSPRERDGQVADFRYKRGLKVPPRCANRLHSRVL